MGLGLFFFYHEQQDVTGDGDVEGLEAVDGGERGQLHQRVRIPEDTPPSLSARLRIKPSSG